VIEYQRILLPSRELYRDSLSSRLHYFVLFWADYRHHLDSLKKSNWDWELP